MLIKYLIVRKVKWKKVKNFEAAWSSGGNYPNNSPRLEMSRGYLSGSHLCWEDIVRAQLSGGNFAKWELYGGNCPGGNCQGAIFWGVIVLGENCLGGIVLGGNCFRGDNCPGAIVLFPLFLKYFRRWRVVDANI